MSFRDGTRSPDELRYFPATEASTPNAPAVDEDMVRAALRRVKDPELNLNIVDLGLVYGIAVEGSKVMINMSLTSPGCPSGQRS